MVKQRSIPLCLLLNLVTCGLYSLYWFVVLTDEVDEVTQSTGPNGIMSLILVVCTFGIYGLYWVYRLGEKLDNSRARNGAPTGNLSLIFLLLFVFGLGIIAYCIAQNELNKYSPY